MEIFGVRIISLVLFLVLTKNLSSNAFGGSMKDEEALMEGNNEMENSISNYGFVFEIPCIFSCCIFSLLGTHVLYICL